MTVTLEHPWFLLFGLLIVPVAWMAWRSIPVLGPVRAWVGCALRIAVLLLLTLALARPSVMHEGDAVSLIVVADTSASVPDELIARAERELGVAVQGRDAARDRIGVIVAGSNAQIASLAAAGPELPTFAGVVQRDATNLGSALQLALAAKPADTAARILLISDGNETAGNALEAADRARAAGVPVDVLPLAYNHRNEIIVESVRAPVRARQGQSVDLRVAIRAQGGGAGRVRLWQNDEPVSLDIDDPNGALAVELSPGANQITVPVVPDSGGAHRFRVTFEPTDPASDTIAENNIGAATIFVSGSGRVLIVEPAGGVEGETLAMMLERGGVEVVRADTERAMQRGLTDMVGYDAVVLANIPRWAVTNEFDRAVHTYVHDLGGGLIMLGGPESFGAGGWLGSETARALPLRLDPPQTRQILRNALAVILDSSGSMSGSVGNTSTSKQAVANEGAIAAIRALSRMDDVTVIAFDSGVQVAVPLTRRGDPRFLETMVRGIGAGGGTVMRPAIDAAIEQLRASRAGTKHAIILTDGQSSDSGESILESVARLRREGATLSTIVIGDDADIAFLRKLAEAGDGRAYEVRSARAAIELPQIFIREATLFARSLIVEGDFATQLVGAATGPLSGITGLPPVGGYILCVPREGLAQIPAVVRNSEGNDPLLAYWNYGTGRSLAFTSDVAPRWGAPWLAWGGVQAFWEQAVRWSMRPAMPQSVALGMRIEEGKAIIDVNTQEHTGGFSAATRAEARVIRPDGTVANLPLRQVGSGRFVGEFDAAETGSYLADVSFAAATGTGEVRAGSVQAAISVPYPAEYRATHDDTATLRAIADRTGGRVLALGSPAAWDLFARSDLTNPRSSRGFWEIAAIVAAVLLLLDVAWRRLAVSRRDAAEWVAIARASSATTPGAAPDAAPGSTPGMAPGLERAPGFARAQPAAPAATGPAPGPAAVTDPLGQLRAARRRAQDNTKRPE